jgi:predicted nucleotidyltransferase
MFGLKENERQLLLNLINHIGCIEEILIYGSRAKGTETNQSDVDLVITKGRCTTTELGHLVSAINESDFPFLVNICLQQTISNDSVKEQIRKVGKVFYQR